jgi:hypothetical protein
MSTSQTDPGNTGTTNPASGPNTGGPAAGAATQQGDPAFTAALGATNPGAGAAPQGNAPTPDQQRAVTARIAAANDPDDENEVTGRFLRRPRRPGRFRIKRVALYAILILGGLGILWASYAVGRAASPSPEEWNTSSKANGATSSVSAVVSPAQSVGAPPKLLLPPAVAAYDLRGCTKKSDYKVVVQDQPVVDPKTNKPIQNPDGSLKTVKMVYRTPVGDCVKIQHDQTPTN